MLKILLKKQLYELNRSFFYDQRSGKCRSKGASIAFIALYVLLMLFISVCLFGVMSAALASPLHELSLDWLYFSIIGIVSVTMGVFGSVFNTFASLYQAKDNSLLLSLPIPVHTILVSRLSGVYLMGLLFSGVVLVPAIVVYNVMVACTVGTVVGGILLLLGISVIVMILSCGLGWIVARINAHLKRKSLLSVIASLVFIGAYYYIYFNSYQLLSSFMDNAAAIGEALSHGAAYPLYLIGRMGLGDALASVIILAAVAALMAFVWWLLSHSFIKLATTPGKVAKTVYREKTAHVRSQSAALLARERQRITSSATCMLNCYLGSLMLLIAAGAIALKGGQIADALSEGLVELFGEGNQLLPLAASTIVCLLVSMNIGTTAAVSLEGKTLWLVQSLPVTAWQALQAKLRFQLIATCVPALICSAVGVVVTWNGNILTTVATILIPQAMALVFAELGLILNIKRPNFNWTTEVAVVKQGLGVFIMLMGGMVFAMLYGLGCVLFVGFAGIYVSVTVIVLGVLAALLRRWLRVRGSRLFAEM